MKNFKVKSVLFSLLAMLTVSVFLTSCSKEEAITDQFVDSVEQMEATSQDQEAFNILLPESITALEPDVAKDYIAKMTPEALASAAKEYATMQFLKERNKLDQYQDYFAKNGTFQGADLSGNLSSAEMRTLRSALSVITPELAQARCRHYVCYYVQQIVGTTWFYKKVCYWI